MSLCLAIETSCDETAAAVVQNGRTIRSNVVASQVALHQVYGGVVPEIASRRHIELILPVVDQALQEAGVPSSALACVAATHGPGLVGSLLVGLMTAKALAYAYRLPFIGVNHIEGHIYANFLEHPDLEPPAVCLTVSGGHTELFHLEGYNRYHRLGRTLDDAAGECLDKVGRVLGLEYPAGPEIDRLAREGDPSAYALPRALGADTFDFSFSGLKTAAINTIHRAKQRGEAVQVADFAASLLEAVVDVLADRALRAVEKTGVQRLMLSGGVAANRRLRSRLEELCREKGVSLYAPSLALCTDNAAMIACAGHYRFVSGERSPLSLNAIPSLRL